MANHKDAVKRARQSEEARVRNKHHRSRMRNQVKALRAAVEAGDGAAAKAMLDQAVSVIQKVAAKGVIHPNQAARRVSRLNAAVKKLVAP